MNTRLHMRSVLPALGLLLLFSLVRAGAQTTQDPPVGRPDAVIDLASHEGVQLVSGQWRYHDVKIEDADSRAVGPDLKPSGAPIRTYDYTPHAGPANFDDSQWEAIDAETLDSGVPRPRSVSTGTGSTSRFLKGSRTSTQQDRPWRLRS